MIKLDNTLDYIVCGIGFQMETIVKYLQTNNIKVLCILTETLTQRPEQSFLIPSKRNGSRNTYSETDLLIDEMIQEVPVKRFDMLSPKELNSVFLYYNEAMSQRLSSLLMLDKRSVVFLSARDLEEINNRIWNSDSIIQELWKTNQYLYSEMSRLKHLMRRQLKWTAYDFHFEFHIVEHCNLNCAGCTHFSPLAKEEYLDVEEFKRDVDRLSVLTGGVSRFINLLGGEPLLHPRITDFIQIARNAFPNTLIRIVTNGILLPTMDELFWRSCQDNNIVLGITQYPINVDYDGIVEQIKSKGIIFESFNGGGEWARDEMWRLALDLEGKHSPLDNFINCPRANICIFVSHGRVYNCATMANIFHFNNFFNQNLKIDSADYVDIYDISCIDELMDKLCTPKPFCRFCNIEERLYGIRWKKSEKELAEWCRLPNGEM